MPSPAAVPLAECCDSVGIPTVARGSAQLGRRCTVGGSRRPLGQLGPFCDWQRLLDLIRNCSGNPSGIAAESK